MDDFNEQVEESIPLHYSADGSPQAHIIRINDTGVVTSRSQVDWYYYQRLHLYAFSAIYDARNVSTNFRKAGPNVIVIGYGYEVFTSDIYCRLWDVNDNVLSEEI